MAKINNKKTTILISGDYEYYGGEDEYIYDDDYDYTSGLLL